MVRQQIFEKFEFSQPDLVLKTNRLEPRKGLKRPFQRRNWLVQAKHILPKFGRFLFIFLLFLEINDLKINALIKFVFDFESDHCEREERKVRVESPYL